MTLKIVSIVGARPNFMKVAPIADAVERADGHIEHTLIHTGQHYDERMSDWFFDDLGMPRPDLNLGVGSGSHAAQTANVMMAVEQPFIDLAPDVVIVVGDVNSTLACALTAKKLGFRVAHVEAGLRSRDMTMPEEINRLCTDAISDILFTPDIIADENLKKEGIDETRIHFVGNVMIDTLLRHLESAKARRYAASLGLEPRSYGMLTLHRPANVDDKDRFVEILDAIQDGVGDLPIVFPAHPRTRQRIMEFQIGDRFSQQPGQRGIWLTDPIGYLEFLELNASARLVLTDSGGLQEETTILSVPCVTLRDNTERPITIEQGTNRLAGTSRRPILAAIADALSSPLSGSKRPDKWDGNAAERIISTLLAYR